MKIPDATQEEPLVTRLNLKAGLTPVATRENPKFPTATQQDISHQSEWLRSKSLQAINAEEGVEKREPSYTVGGNAN